MFLTKTQTHGDDNIFIPVSEFSMSFNPDIFQPHVVHVDPEVRETYTDLDGVGGFYHGEYEISCDCFSSGLSASVRETHSNLCVFVPWGV